MHKHISIMTFIIEVKVIMNFLSKNIYNKLFLNLLINQLFVIYKGYNYYCIDINEIQQKRGIKFVEKLTNLIAPKILYSFKL